MTRFVLTVTATAAAITFAVSCRKPRRIDAERAAALFDRVPVDTQGGHGLSGLAVDRDGALWTVAERGAVAFRIQLDGTAITSTTRIPVEGLPPGEDLEAAAALPDGDLVVGTEGRTAGTARLFRLHRDGDVLRVTGEPITIGKADAGIDVGANHGAEAACSVGTRVAVALETAGQDASGRWAPLVIVDLASGRRTGHRVRLRTATGKLSGLDCWADGDRVRAIAIERHFEVTQVVGFDLPADGAATTDLTTTQLLDLGPALRGSLNLEGLVRLADGRLIAVVDNQYRGVNGPDELLVFKSPVR